MKYKKRTYRRIENLENLLQNRVQDLSYALFRTLCRRHTKATRLVLYYERGGRCAYPYCRQTDIKRLTLDHIVPISTAYNLNWSVALTNDKENLQLLCQKHHALKDANAPDLRIAAYYLATETQLESVGETI